MSTATVAVADRPYIITFLAIGDSYPLTSDEVRRLVAEHPLVRGTAMTLVLRADDGQHCKIRPSTLSGGPAFGIVVTVDDEPFGPDVELPVPS